MSGDAKSTACPRVLMIEHPALVETSSVGMVKVDMRDVRIHICCKLRNFTESEKPTAFDSAFGLIELGLASPIFDSPRFCNRLLSFFLIWRSQLSPFTTHRSPLTIHPSPLTPHRSPLTPHHSPNTNHLLPSTFYLLPIIPSATSTFPGGIQPWQ